MKLTSVLLRGYRSFNIRTLPPDNEGVSDPWDTFEGQPFPFVRIPVTAPITTIVGANERGKSHLLAAISKGLTGNEGPGSVEDRYGIKDICRYCAFNALDDRIWPQLALEMVLEEAKVIGLFAGLRHVASSDQRHNDPTSRVTARSWL